MTTDQKTQLLANLRLRLAWEESGRAFTIQIKTQQGEWVDLVDELYCAASCEYRRKPEPTPEEKRDAVQKEWEAMTPDGVSPKNSAQTVRKDKDGKRFVCECRRVEGGGWFAAEPAFDHWYEYHIVPLPSLSNAEQNAAAKAELQRILDAGGRAEVTRVSLNGDLADFPHRTKQEFDAHGWLDNQPWNETFTFTVKALPAPAVVPWTRETCPVGAVVVNKDMAGRFLIVGAVSNGLYMGMPEDEDDLHTYKSVLEEWTLESGSPCGTLEGEGK